MSSRIMHFTAKGFKPQLIDITRDATNPHSKRSSIIEKEDETLNNNLDNLELTTKARNQGLEDRLNAVWGMSNGWEARLLTEKDEAKDSIDNLKNNYMEHINIFKKDILNHLNTIFNKFDNELLPISNENIDIIEKDYRFYLNIGNGSHLII